MNGHQRILETLVKNHALVSIHDNTENKQTAVHVAAANGNFLLFKYVSERIEEVNPKQSNGFTALHLAAQEGHLQICEYMISNIQGVP